MSWFYRKFSKSDDDRIVTIASDYIQLTGAATITGALTLTGAVTQSGGALAPANLNVTTAATAAKLTVTGTAAFGQAATFVNNLTISGTTRHVGYVYLGTGTMAIVFGTSGIDPINTGIAGSYDKGSMFLGGTANCYYKTGYASTEWASVDAVD